MLRNYYTDKKLDFPYKLTSVFTDIEIIYFIKPLNLFFAWIYPITVGVMVLTENFIISFFPNKLIYYSFFIVNFIIVYLITFTKFNINKFMINLIRKLFLWNVK